MTKVIRQRKDWDCGVASIAMLLGVDYRDVSATVAAIIDDPKLKKRGLILYQLEDVIAAFGFETKRVYRKKDYLDGANGILGMNGGNMDAAGHWVVVKDGMILDPDDASVSSLEDYIKENNCRPATLVTLA
jgi:ABC-type bacteriocin/lantibiotic exporter with double-glycine peptidase domain